MAGDLALRVLSTTVERRRREIHERTLQLRLETFQPIRRERRDRGAIEDFERGQSSDQWAERDAAVHHRDVNVPAPLRKSDDGV